MRTALFALLFTAAVGAADDPKKADPPKKEDAPAAPKDQYAALKKSLSEALTAFNKDMRAAKTAEEREKLNDAFQPKHEKLCQDILALAKTNLKADFALDALLTATRDDTTATEAVAVAVREFADDRRILGFVPMLEGLPDGAKILAKLADSKSKDVRGNVRFQLLSQQVEKIDSAEPTKTPADPDKAFAGVLDKLQAVEKEYGDVTLGASPFAKTVADAAKDVRYQIANLVVGRTLPDVPTTAVADDKKVKVSDYRGKVLVLDIWATWCGPCRAMIPHEKEMVEKFKDRPFALVSVSADDDKKTLTKFLEKTEMPWTHWHDGADGDLMKTYQVQFFPTIYVLDAKGVIRYKHVRDKDLDKAVETLLKETDKK